MSSTFIETNGIRLHVLQIAPEAVRGMVISSAQALQMVGLLGVVVEDEELGF